MLVLIDLDIGCVFFELLEKILKEKNVFYVIKDCRKVRRKKK